MTDLLQLSLYVLLSELDHHRGGIPDVKVDW